MSKLYKTSSKLVQLNNPQGYGRYRGKPDWLKDANIVKPGDGCKNKYIFATDLHARGDDDRIMQRDTQNLRRFLKRYYGVEKSTAKIL